MKCPNCGTLVPRSEPEGVVLADETNGGFVTELPNAILVSSRGVQQMRLRVGRGTIRDVPVKGTHGEAHD